jgi:3-deoxy-D-manno-octulosonate 8-phosphate phosphatase (KDO 8-P phosphatase)
VNEHELKDKLNKIKVLVMDVDGVLTDGRIIVDAHGQELKFFNVHDGFGIVIAQRLGIKTVILSARGTNAVKVRARDLKITKVYLNAIPKEKAYAKMLKELKVLPSEVCFIGDDLNDIHVLRQVGFKVTVPHAVREVKKEVDYVTKIPGGHGAVREVIEMILKTQGKWRRVLQEYA